MGTSDCLFASLKNPKPSLVGNIFCSAQSESGYVACLTFKNGSFARERLRRRLSGDQSWEHFTALLKAEPIGNHGRIGIFLYDQEIQPRAQGIWCFDASGRRVDQFESEAVQVRALVEGQFLARRLHAERLGVRFGSTSRAGNIIVTGGASRNDTIVQIIANIFQRDVYRQAIAESGAYGGACTAASLIDGQSVERPEETRPKLAARPDVAAASIYADMLERYGRLEDSLGCDVQDV